MKNLLYPIYCLSLLFLLSLITTGCPVGIAYPLSEEADLEPIDKKLLGTWVALSDSADILEVKIMQANDNSYGVEVLREGESYMMESTNFYSWITKIDGHSFIFSQEADSDEEDFYLYHYAFEGKKLVIHDVSLLIGGMDAVTSTEAFREEVSASLKNTDCLTSRFEYEKQ